MPTAIEFLHDWGVHRIGQVVDALNPSDAEVLVMNNIARPAGLPALKPTTVTTTAVSGPPAAEIAKPKPTPKKPTPKKAKGQ